MTNIEKFRITTLILCSIAGFLGGLLVGQFVEAMSHEKISSSAKILLIENQIKVITKHNDFTHYSIGDTIPIWYDDRINAYIIGEDPLASEYSPYPVKLRRAVIIQKFK